MPHEPKRRHSRERKGKRRASIHLQIEKGITCPNCGKMVVSHHACKFCGFYKGKAVVIKKEPKEKADEK